MCDFFFYYMQWFLPSLVFGNCKQLDYPSYLGDLLKLHWPLPQKNGQMCSMDQCFLLTIEQKPPWEVDKQTDISERMTANSPERLVEVIVPKTGKERQDMGDAEKGAAFQDRQEALTYGNWIKGHYPVSVQLFETKIPWSLSSLVSWP